VQSALSSVPPAQKEPAGQAIPPGPDDPPGQKNPAKAEHGILPPI